ncbi:Ankyrin repeat-containing domain-containing protein [Cinnamomum micranthum f. kanehirae]|uniref:Ankyrin repeat-containing domain-containing protein n=1 Tax=Cinnamomum micranthum f. kanehirae TaxID=337451 RepID=A0A3S3PY19_9MAGN|nr:Ankyrin repeat-containing domain-containing protein [Cinnamomum micranthum f. kanehirae]
MGESQFIKSSMPTNLLTIRNGEGKTSMEVFEETHEGIIKDGVQWLNSTSQSCSVIAALIASVAYASAATVPGGDNQNNGIPILKGDPSFDTFINASLVALCFSVTSLTMFLSILTANSTIHDFLHNLPTKLLLGLTTLFISIGAMLVSFCAGHFFNSGDRNRNTGSSVFAIICLPVSAYALTQFRLLISLVNAPF